MTCPSQRATLEKKNLLVIIQNKEMAGGKRINAATIFSLPVKLSLKKKKAKVCHGTVTHKCRLVRPKKQ